MSIYQESVYGSFNSGGSIAYPRLVGGNAFTMRKGPQRQVIRSADAGNRRVQVVSARKVYAGTLNMALYPSQAAYWLTALTGLAGNALPSYSIQYWDSVQAWRFVGCIAQSGKITSSATADEVMLSINWIAQQRDNTFTTFAQPAASNYPTEVPYEHYESASNFTLGGSAITKYKTLEVNINNILQGTWDEQQYITSLLYCGRDLDLSFGPQYLATTYRTDFESQTALTFSVNWTRSSPAHSLTLNCETNSYMSTIDDDLPLDGPGYQTIGVQVFYDPTNSTDFVATVS
jgi:hypothetical protein